MEVITITSKDGITDERETVPEDSLGLYPEAAWNPESRPFVFTGKRVIFFTSRVHPGETPGSHVLNGSLDIICDPKSE